MEQSSRIRLFLDRNEAGQNCSRYAVSLSDKYQDESGLYANHDDLNDWIINVGRSDNSKQQGGDDCSLKGDAGTKSQ